MVAIVVVQMGGNSCERGDQGADGESQEKVLKPLLKLRSNSRKDEEVGVVGYGAHEQANEGIPSCENKNVIRELMNQEGRAIPHNEGVKQLV